MQPLTKEQAIVISGYTMVLICEFDDLQKEIEKRLGCSVFSHQLLMLEEQIKASFKEDFLALAPIEEEVTNVS